MRPVRVSVVIVALNRIASVRKSLAALGEEHQVALVDNGSTDGGASLGGEFPSLRFHRLPRNFGLTKALNIGIRACDGEFILLLHDDVLISAAAVTKLADYLEAHPDVAAVCPRLTDAAGSAVKQVRALPTPANPDPPYSPVAGSGETAVECVSGAAIMMRSFFLRSLGYIDERYGTYGSEIELCGKVRSSGKKLVVLGDVTAVHEWAGSPVSKSALEGDRTHGTASYLAKHHGLMTGMTQRLSSGLSALASMKLRKFGGAIVGQKIDGSS